MASLDLDAFDDPELEVLTGVVDAAVDQSGALSAAQALDLCDTVWYSTVSRGSRWMDLIGDYAGNERFVLDGTDFVGARISAGLMVFQVNPC